MKPGFPAAIQEFTNSRVKRLAVKLLEQYNEQAVEQAAVRRCIASPPGGKTGRKPEAD
ncbi:MAG: hypothetical protein AB1815_05210 [Bacillota bacterium]